MLIRKARKEDFEKYLSLKKEEEKEYHKIFSRVIYKKEFEDIFSKRQILLIAEEKGNFMGFLYGSFFSNIYNKGGFIENIFVLKKFRRIGVAHKLVNFFVGMAESKGYKKIQLSVNKRNKGAMKFYKKIGFEIHHYDLKKEWK